MLAGMEGYPTKATRRALFVGLLPVALIRGIDGDRRHIAPKDASGMDVSFLDFRRDLNGSGRRLVFYFGSSFTAPSRSRLGLQRPQAGEAS